MKAALSLFLSVFILNTFSQNIKGKIVESSGAGIPFATISIFNADSMLVAGGVSDESGAFQIAVLAGTYYVKTTAIGYEEKIIGNLKMEENIDLGNITLIQGSLNMDEVSVTAIRKSIEFKNGNLTFNVDNSPLTQGNNLYQLLQKLPGVMIDDKSISLNGKSGVMVLIDGRLQRLTHQQLITIFKSINATSVQKVELLKNPPVKYDAQGISGMINIVTKKNKVKGINGNLNSSVSQGFYARANGGASLNIMGPKLAVFSGVDFSRGDYQTVARFDRVFVTDSFTTQMIADNYQRDPEKGLYGKIGMDWTPNNKNTIGFKIDGGPGSYGTKGSVKTNVYGDNTLGFDHMFGSVKNLDAWKQINYNINAEHKFDSLGTVLSISSDYTQLYEKITSDIGNYFYDVNDAIILNDNVYRNKNITNAGIAAAKVDFTKVIDTISSFDAGAKYSVVRTENGYEFERRDSLLKYLKDSLLSNNFSYYEETYAGYINYKRQLNKWQLESGLRVENTRIKGENPEKNFELTRTYTNFFPNISLSITPNEKHIVQLNYNRRIERPSFNSLNPFIFFIDQYQYYAGNPFLLPHYSNTFEASHIYNENIGYSLSYTHVANVMMGYTIQNDSSKVFHESEKNMRFHDTYSYNFFFQQDIKKWWNLSINQSFYYVIVEGEVLDVPFHSELFSYYPTMTSLFTIKKKTKLEVSGYYNSGRNNGMVKVKSRWMTSIACKRNFLKDKLSCSIGIEDLFRTGGFRTSAKVYNQNWNYKVYNDSQRFTLSISYNFGKMESEEREVSSSNDEKARLGK